MSTERPSLPSDADRTAPEEASSRRAFIRAAALLASGLMLARNSLSASARNQPQITESVLAEAEKICGLSFTDEERAMMTGPLNHARENYEKIRALRLPNDVPPALQFQVAALPPETSSPTPSEAPATAKPTRPDSDEELAFCSVGELAPLVREGKVSPVELTELYLKRLKHLGPKLNCVVSLREAEARAEARAAEREIREGRWRGPLHGIPWGAKDLLATRDAPTTWGAAPYKDQQLGYDAAVVERLREAGAILVAKLSLGALAQGDVWFKGRTLSPWDTNRGTSGSSAGPGAATASGLVGFSIGSETNGSIVMPSTICGVTGLRPTFGRVSRYGAMSLSFSMDKLGPMCRSVEDCALVFAAIHGADPRDPASRDAPFVWPPVGTGIAGMRLGFLEKEFSEVRNPDDAALNRRTLEQLEELGARLVPHGLPDFPVDPLRMILTVESAAMFDELTLSDRDDELRLQHPFAWPNSFRTARMIPAVEYLKAQQARTVLMRKMEETMNGIDALVTPSMTGQALPITNLTGHPALTLPNGFVRGTPRSITFVGNLYGDDTILRLGHAWQKTTDWHTRHPVLA